MVVLVTAGASGIGRVIAERFATGGMRVFVCDNDSAALDRCRNELPGITGIRTDVADPAAVQALFALILGVAGRVDVLVNNAGVAGPRAPIDEIDTNAWRRTLAVNLDGAFYCLREAARLMKVARQGAIVNISTSSVRCGLPSRTPYIVSKSGLMGMTLNAARELGPYGIRVNAVLPGYVDGPRANAVASALAAERGVPVENIHAEAVSFISMRSPVQPHDVAEMVWFLASPSARFVSGQFIGVDGNQEWEA
jgi:NAD(P)-dependent dehydrogenase (short-subunit alcohol dehydrogenase family)